MTKLFSRSCVAYLAAALLVCSGVWAGPARADQTDPRLEELFEELRLAEPMDAPAISRRIFEIWARSDSDTVSLLFSRAEESIDDGAPVLAGELLDHVLDLSPSFAEAYVRRAAVRLEQSDRTGAAADLARAVELEPRHFEARIALSDLLRADGDARGAYEMIAQALYWNPNAPGAVERARAIRGEIDGQEI